MSHMIPLEPVNDDEEIITQLEDQIKPDNMNTNLNFSILERNMVKRDIYQKYLTKLNKKISIIIFLLSFTFFLLVGIIISSIIGISISLNYAQPIINNVQNATEQVQNITGQIKDIGWQVTSFTGQFQGLTAQFQNFINNVNNVDFQTLSANLPDLLAVAHKINAMNFTDELDSIRSIRNQLKDYDLSITTIISYLQKIDQILQKYSS